MLHRSFISIPLKYLHLRRNSLNLISSKPKKCATLMSQAYLCMRFRIFLTPKLCKAPLKPYLVRIVQNPQIEMRSTF